MQIAIQSWRDSILLGARIASAAWRGNRPPEGNRAASRFFGHSGCSATRARKRDAFIIRSGVGGDLIKLNEVLQRQFVTAAKNQKNPESGMANHGATLNALLPTCDRGMHPS